MRRLTIFDRESNPIGSIEMEADAFERVAYDGPAGEARDRRNSSDRDGYSSDGDGLYAHDAQSDPDNDEPWEQDAQLDDDEDFWPPEEDANEPPEDSFDDGDADCPMVEPPHADSGGCEGVPEDEGGDDGCRFDGAESVPDHILINEGAIGKTEAQNVIRDFFSRVKAATVLSGIPPKRVSYELSVKSIPEKWKDVFDSQIGRFMDTGGYATPTLPESRGGWFSGEDSDYWVDKEYIKQLRQNATGDCDRNSELLKFQVIVEPEKLRAGYRA